MPKLVSKSEAARQAGRSRRWIYNLIRDGVLQDGPKVDLNAVLEIKQNREQKMESRKDTRSLTEERAELTRVKREVEEIKLKKLQGELIPVEEAKAAWSMVVAAAKARLRAIPTSAAPKMDGMDVQEREDLLREAIDEALIELSQGISDSGSLRGMSGVSAPAKDDSKRVGRKRKASKRRK